MTISRTMQVTLGITAGVVLVSAFECFSFVPLVYPAKMQSQLASGWSRNVAVRAKCSRTALNMADFGSDFASAMPVKPEQTLHEKTLESAEQMVETIEKSLGEGVEAPSELAALREAVDTNADTNTLALRIYELMIERGMRYDEEPETGTLTPTNFDIKENLDVKEVRDEFGHLYKYGMMLMDREMLTAEQVKTTVLDRLIARTGLSPEEFDKWLGY